MKNLFWLLPAITLVFLSCNSDSESVSTQAPTYEYELDFMCEWNGVSEEYLGVVRTILESNQIEYTTTLGWQFMCLYNSRFQSDPGYPDYCDYCSFLVNPNLALHEDSVSIYRERQKAILFGGDIDDFTESTMKYCKCTQEKLGQSLKDYAWYLHDLGY